MTRVGRKANHAKSASRRFVTGRPVLHGAKLARPARHGTRTLCLQRRKLNAADVGWSQ